jgi:hypothetical protein
MSEIQKNPEQSVNAEQPIEGKIDDLPAKEITKQDAQAVKGGFEYKPQKPDGSV